MHCPACNTQMVLCEQPSCNMAPHFHCTNEECRADIPATKADIQQYRWPKEADAARNELLLADEESIP